jgi:uroporphyrinogen decarboxylase
MSFAGSIDHRTRLENILAGKAPDRPAVALWRHFPVDDQEPGNLAAAAAAFQRQYDFDLIKVTPASSFSTYDWGMRDEWLGVSEGTRSYTNTVIHQPDDWLALPVLDPRKGRLGAQLEVLRLLAGEFSPQTPILQTIFSPLSQAKNLVGKANLAIHARKYPDALRAGLQTISETTRRFIEEAAKNGIDGLFYAVQFAQYGLFSEQEYCEFEKAYDLQVLESTENLWLNMLHLHGNDVMFEQAVDYPVQIINWHDRHTAPSLAEAARVFDGVLCGGLRREETMVLGTPAEVTREAHDAMRSLNHPKFILGTGCVVPITAPHGNLLAARRSVETFSE